MLLAKSKRDSRPKVCRRKWSKAKYEKCLKDVEKQGSDYNKWAVCASICKKDVDT